MKEKNVFYTACICSILLLLTMCYFGINSPVKGTNAGGECGDKYSIEYSGVTYCCPKRRSSIKVYNGQYYCFDKTSAADDLVFGICVASVFMTSYEDSLTYIQGNTYKNSLCKSKLGSNWYYTNGIVCGVAMGASQKCTCHANASVCSTLATKPPKTVTLTYNANGGSVSLTTDTCVTDGSIQNTCSISSSKWPTPTRTGYVFNGWSSTANCPSGKGSTSSISLSDDKTVWACWKKKEFKITFYPNGGTITNGNKELTCDPGSYGKCTVSASEFPIVSNGTWKFNGWTSGTNCPTGIGTTTDITLFNENNVRYACWKKESILKLVYADNINKIITSHSCVKYNGDTTACKFNAPGTPDALDSEKTEFIGWSQNKACDNPSNRTSFSVYSNDATYYACFAKKNSEETEQKPNQSEPETPSGPEPAPSNPIPTPSEPAPEEETFDVTFDKNASDATLNGKSSDSCTTKTGSCSISGLPSATRSGYTFKGWGTSSSCTLGNTSEISLTEDATYYACWVKELSDPDPSDDDPGTSGEEKNPIEDSEVPVDDDGNVTENQQTGDIAIFIILVVALSLMVYAIWYFKQVREI